MPNNGLTLKYKAHNGVDDEDAAVTHSCYYY